MSSRAIIVELRYLDGYRETHTCTFFRASATWLYLQNVDGTNLTVPALVLRGFSSKIADAPAPAVEE